MLRVMSAPNLFFCALSHTFARCNAFVVVGVDDQVRFSVLTSPLVRPSCANGDRQSTTVRDDECRIAIANIPFRALQWMRKWRFLELRINGQKSGRRGHVFSPATLWTPPAPAQAALDGYVKRRAVNACLAAADDLHDPSCRMLSKGKDMPVAKCDEWPRTQCRDGENDPCNLMSWNMVAAVERQREPGRGPVGAHRAARQLGARSNVSWWPWWAIRQTLNAMARRDRTINSRSACSGMMDQPGKFACSQPSRTANLRTALRRLTADFIKAPDGSFVEEC